MGDTEDNGEKDYDNKLKIVIDFLKDKDKGGNIVNELILYIKKLNNDGNNNNENDNINDNINDTSRGGKFKKGKKKKTLTLPISRNKESQYKDVLGKRMKIYKKPDSRKEYVKYKGELHPISDYKNLMKQNKK